MNFENLSRKNFNFYRGWAGTDKKALVRQVGIGPAREVADALVHIEPRPTGDEINQAALWLMQRIAQATNTPPHSIFGTDDIDRLDRLLALPAVAGNIFTVFEHVVDAPDRPNQINSMYTNRAVESTSKDPRVAIRYAYGIDPDTAQPGVPARVLCGRANDEAIVAVVEETTDSELERVPSNVTGVDAKETERRINRDSEVFAKIVKKARIVMLPSFDPSDYTGSLNRAADTLRTAGVALLRLPAIILTLGLKLLRSSYTRRFLKTENPSPPASPREIKFPISISRRHGKGSRDR